MTLRYTDMQAAIVLPWFMVETDKGRIQVGWRKRVMEIDWSRTQIDIQGKDVDDSVTHGPSFVHCWTDEKAVEALRAIWHGA